MDKLFEIKFKSRPNIVLGSLVDVLLICASNYIEVSHVEKV